MGDPSVWQAVAWGALAAASLYIGQALAGPLGHMRRMTGMVMGFGAGALLSAVAYELIPLSTFEENLGRGLGVAFVIGALFYFVGDRLTERIGGSDRQAAEPQGAEGTGLGMFLGILLDGVPESFILGGSLAAGGAVSGAFLAAIFISNVPEAVAGSLNLKAIGYTDRHVFGMWSAIVVASGISAGAGYLIAHSLSVDGAYAEAFAGGAVLTMLADSMMPQAFRNGGTWVGLMTVFGYLFAATLSAVG